jgi:nicotinate-nucleotide adenylyltransferase
LLVIPAQSRNGLAGGGLDSPVFATTRLGMSSTAAPGVRRIGIFGGAFDPPHIGHDTLARTALMQLKLDALRVIPTGSAWHKTRTLTAAVHRIAMARLAFESEPRIVVDSREIDRDGPTYTVDTLEELHRENPQAQLYLVIGEDQARALPTWHRWRELATFAIICVAARADSTGAQSPFESLKLQIPGMLRLEMPPVAVSATEIRSKVAHHQSVDALVFASVARYIEHHNLYHTA